MQVGLSVVAERRGEGWGAALVRAGVDRLTADAGAVDVHALVKHDNTASARSFELAGFEPLPDERPGPEPVLHFVCRPRQAGAVAAARTTP